MHLYTRQRKRSCLSGAGAVFKNLPQTDSNCSPCTMFSEGTLWFAETNPQTFEDLPDNLNAAACRQMETSQSSFRLILCRLMKALPVEFFMTGNQKESSGKHACICLGLKSEANKIICIQKAGGGKWLVCVNCTQKCKKKGTKQTGRNVINSRELKSVCRLCSKLCTYITSSVQHTYCAVH